MKANVGNQEYFMKLVNDGILSVYKSGIVKNNKTGKVYNRRNNKGYIEVAAKRNGKKIAILAHRLVYLVHKGNLGADDQINHLNGIKNSNNVKNFEKTDNKGNCQHAWDTGLKFTTEQTKNTLNAYQRGQKGSNAKLSNKQAIEIRRLYATGDYTHQQLANKFKVSRPTVTSVIAHRTFKIGFTLILKGKK